MKKFFKILGIILLIFFAIFYICFLFVLPKKIDLNAYKSDLQKIVKEQANLNLDYGNVQVITTPLLAAGVKIDNINIKLPDNSEIFSTDSIKATVSLPQILLLRLNVNCVEIDNPIINLEILKNGEDYKVVKHIEDILNQKKELSFGEKPIVKEKEGFQFNPNWIKIFVPNVKLKNYKVIVKDLGTDHYLDLHGDNLVFGYFNRERIRVKTIAELYSDKQKNVIANIDFSTFLPAPSPKLDEEDDPAEKIDFNFINPVKTYQTYDLKTNIDGKINIKKNKKGIITSFGHLNIEDINLKISKIQLPKSYIRLKNFGTKVSIDTNLYTSNDENLIVTGSINYSNKPNANVSIKTEKISFSKLLQLSEALLESLNIPNELNQFKANGALTANCNIKTNFKKLKSNGYIKIQQGSLSVRNLGEVLSKINVNLILDNNILDIPNSSLFVGNSEVKINGFIDEKSNTDVNIKIEKLSLPILFNAFAPEELRNNFSLKSGILTSDFTVKGKMKEAVTNLNAKLNNLSFGDKKNSFNIQNDELYTKFNFEAKKQNLLGNILNKNLKLTLLDTESKITFPETKIEIQDKNIQLIPNIMHINNNSAIAYSGNIENYEKLTDINISANGKMNTNDIIKFIGNDLASFINFKGNIPVKISFTGNKLKQTLFVQGLADELNYITPIDFTKLQKLKTSTQATVDFKPNRIKIKNTGLYTVNSQVDENGEEKTTLNKVMELDGTIEHDNINLLKFDIPENLEGKIFVFPKSKFTLEKGKFFAYSKTLNPILRGDLIFSDLTIPEIQTAIKNIKLSLSNQDLNFNISEMLLKNSDLNIKGGYNILSKNPIPTINNLEITSKFINVDDLTTVSDNLMKYLPQSKSSNQNSKDADIPIEVDNGSIDLKRIVLDKIELTNTASRFNLTKNVLRLRDLSTHVFNGNVNGDIDVNLISILINTDLKGKNIDIEKALLDSSGIKGMLSGTAEFAAKLNIDGNAKTPEAQLKGIKGDIDFTAIDGQFGPFGKLENLILAENIRESKFFQTALGGVINSLTTIDTTHFSELKGHINLQDGICVIDPITSKGNVMNLHILGKFDLIKNYADMKVRVKMTSILSNLLGPINAINPVNLVNSAASMNVVTAKAFSMFCEAVPEEEFAILPEFSNKYVDLSSTKFQLGVRGDAAKPLTLIKSFKWLISQSQYDKAEEFVNSIPEPIEGSTATTIEEVIAEVEAQKAAQEAELQAQQEAERKSIKHKLKNMFKIKKD